MQSGPLVFNVLMVVSRSRFGQLKSQKAYGQYANINASQPSMEISYMSLFIVSRYHSLTSHITPTNNSIVISF